MIKISVKDIINLGGFGPLNSSVNQHIYIFYPHLRTWVLIFREGGSE